MVCVSWACGLCVLLGEKGSWGTRQDAWQAPQCTSSTLLTWLWNLKWTKKEYSSVSMYIKLWMVSSLWSRCCAKCNGFMMVLWCGLWFNRKLADIPKFISYGTIGHLLSIILWYPGWNCNQTKPRWSCWGRVSSIFRSLALTDSRLLLTYLVNFFILPTVLFKLSHLLSKTPPWLHFTPLS